VDLDPVQDVDDVVAPGRRRWRDRSGYERRPALGLLPWFAGLRRAFVLRFEVFFDIGPRGYRSFGLHPSESAAAT
jgi:hypothetical protein